MTFLQFLAAVHILTVICDKLALDAAAYHNKQWWQAF